MNQPPQVVYPNASNAPVELPVFNNDFTPVYAVAADPERDILTFVWTIPRANVEPQPNTRVEGDTWHSSLLLPREWLRDGETLEVSISDQAQPRNVVTVQWIVREDP